MPPIPSCRYRKRTEEREPHHPPRANAASTCEPELLQHDRARIDAGVMFSAAIGDTSAGRDRHQACGNLAITSGNLLPLPSAFPPHASLLPQPPRRRLGGSGLHVARSRHRKPGRNHGRSGRPRRESPVNRIRRLLSIRGRAPFADRHRAAGSEAACRARQTHRMRP